MFIDPAVNCVFIKHYGTFSYGIIAETAESRINHADFQVGMNVFNDARDLHFPRDLAPEEVSDAAKLLIETHDPNKGRCRSAIFVDDGYAYAIAKQFSVSNRLSRVSIEREVFRELDKAKSWLGLPEDYEIKFPK